MKADVSYNDFKGTAAADIADYLGSKSTNDIDGLANKFNIDTSKLKPIGLSIFGTDNFNISLICVDIEKSTNEKEHIVKMSFNESKKASLNDIFKRFEVILYNKHDSKYPNIDGYEEVNYEDYHN